MTKSEPQRPGCGPVFETHRTQYGCSKSKQTPQIKDMGRVASYLTRKVTRKVTGIQPPTKCQHLQSAAPPLPPSHFWSGSQQERREGAAGRQHRQRQCPLHVRVQSDRGLPGAHGLVRSAEGIVSTGTGTWEGRGKNESPMPTHLLHRPFLPAPHSRKKECKDLSQS